jgi:hypothetical protein
MRSSRHERRDAVFVGHIRIAAEVERRVISATISASPQVSDWDIIQIRRCHLRRASWLEIRQLHVFGHIPRDLQPN